MGAVARLRRSEAHEPLLSLTWLQPIEDRNSSMPIILDRSGDPDTPWPRLQGSVRLYVERFLTVEADLWLNTPGEGFPDAWRMAPPPQAPASMELLFVASNGTLWPGDEAAAAEAGPREERATPAPTTNTGAEPEPATDAGTLPAYPFRHAVRLTQTRRMRSGELHYIDHPRFGLLLRITPMDDATLSRLADVESQRAWRARHRANASTLARAGLSLQN